MDDFTSSYLSSSLATAGRLKSLGRLLAVCESVRPDIAASAVQSILAEIPAFASTRNPDVLRQLHDHVDAHLRQFLRMLSTRQMGGLEFVREHAIAQAEHRFPLDATLHAYRCIQQALARRLPMAGESQSDLRSAKAHTVINGFLTDYISAASTVAAQAYAEHSRRLAEAAVDRRSLLMTLLLDGYDEADPRMATLLRSAGLLDERQIYCVAVARAVDAGEMANPERARRLAEALNEQVPDSLARCLTDVRDDTAVAVYSATRRISGFSAPSGALAPRLAKALASAGPSVLIGISADAIATAHVPAAHRQARIALDLATVSKRVITIGQMNLDELAVHLAGDSLRALLPAWSADFIAANREAGDVFAQTLLAYARADMNALKAAARLDIHANTLYARLQRISQLTGLDARRHRALAELIVVIRLDATMSAHTSRT